MLPFCICAGDVQEQHDTDRHTPTYEGAADRKMDKTANEEYYNFYS